MVSKQMARMMKAIGKTFQSGEDMVEVWRKGLNTITAALVLPEGVKAESFDIKGVPAKWISTPETIQDRVLYFLHGGGHVSGSIKTHQDFAARLSRVAKARVLLIDYRLAPEHPFPAGLNDAVKAYKWLVDDEKIDSKNIIIGGDSAGGNLALTTLLKLKELEVELPAAGVLISPWTDMVGTGESMITKAEVDPFISPIACEFFSQLYARDRDLTNPLISPLYGDLQGLPPLFIQVGTAEVLLDDSIRLAKRAKAIGVEVELDVWEDMIHDFAMFAAVVPESQQGIDNIGKFLLKHFT
jgi:acetyl esterase/lipase